jgi:hypothetical protein
LKRTRTSLESHCEYFVLVLAHARYRKCGILP